MAGFIYAIEKARTISKQVLDDAGLAPVLGDIETAQRHTTAGPGGAECVLLMGAGADTKLLYYRPDQQTWYKSLNDKYWVGFYNDDPPGPDILARKEQISGHEVELGSGQEWTIPCARVFPQGTSLPQALILGPGGKVVAELLPKYAQFSMRAGVLWDDFMRQIGALEGPQQLSAEDEWLLAVEALSFNYRVGPDEINALKLLSTANFTKVTYAIVDVPTFDAKLKDYAAGQKKTEKVPPGSSGGG